MIKRKLSGTDFEISTIGLGSWALGGGGWQFGWGPQDEKESILTVRHALDLGVNWIDTAPVFGFGRSEEIIGKAIKDLKEKPFIATKFGLVWTKGKTMFGRLTRKSIMEEVEASLRRLQVDAIDLYQMHWPNPDPDLEVAWTTIAQMVKEGKIRYAGAANFNIEQLKRIAQIHPVASLQLNYNMIYRDIKKDMSEFCALNNIGILACNPLQKGLLTGKITKEWIQCLPAISPRLRDPEFKEPDLSANMKLIAELDEIARRTEKTVAQISVAWVLRQPGISSVIIGARNPSQADETFPPGEWQLPEEEVAAIDALLSERARTLHIK